MEGLNVLGEPTMSSLGLGSYWPSGLVQQALELIHVNMGVPWWGSIVLCKHHFAYSLVVQIEGNRLFPS